MTIEKGQAWGQPGALPPDAVIARTDAEARAVVERARRSGEPVPPLGLLGGDLCRTVGGAGDEARLRSGEAMHLPVDLGAVLIDGRLHWFVAHLVARKRWWRGRVYVAMNAEFLGRWDVAPRSHPNDGLLDTFEVTMSPGERFKARSRLATGTHVPHQGIKQRRVSAVQVDAAGLDVWLDGELVGPAQSLSIRIEPDALTCVV
ncbi:MAG: hypothetical protein QOD38_1148 [Acidimicrobiaceae bacterium]|jgi:hypothetical protein